MTSPCPAAPAVLFARRRPEQFQYLSIAGGKLDLRTDLPSGQDIGGGRPGPRKRDQVLYIRVRHYDVARFVSA